MFSSKKDNWETPQDFFNKLDDEFNFSWDLAASSQNAKCEQYIDKSANSLSIDWSKLSGNLYLNPPYGREIKKWVKKASETSLKDNYLVMLIPARTDTSYWHDYIFGKAEIKFLRGRLRFEIDGISGDSAPFPSAVIIYGG
jgi:site-specific DNA-methyltransferase (adenine-specific)